MCDPSPILDSTVHPPTFVILCICILFVDVQWEAAACSVFFILRSSPLLSTSNSLSLLLYSRSPFCCTPLAVPTSLSRTVLCWLVSTLSVTWSCNLVMNDMMVSPTGLCKLYLFLCFVVRLIRRGRKRTWEMPSNFSSANWPTCWSGTTYRAGSHFSSSPLWTLRTHKSVLLSFPLSVATGTGVSSYDAFDFHKECSRMRWHRLSILLDRLLPTQNQYAWESETEKEKEGESWRENDGGREREREREANECLCWCY